MFLTLGSTGVTEDLFDSIRLSWEVVEYVRLVENGIRGPGNVSGLSEQREARGFGRWNCGRDYCSISLSEFHLSPRRAVGVLVCLSDAELTPPGLHFVNMCQPHGIPSFGIGMLAAVEPLDALECWRE